MGIINRIFDRKAAPLLMVVFAALVIIERRRQLRKTTQPKIERLMNNTLVAIPSFGLLRFLLLPIMVKLAFKNKVFGSNRLFSKSPTLQLIYTYLVLDYGNYLWHVANHKIPLLWRFHLVHHTDLDMDVFTAFRFHFGEMIGSIFSRGLFVLVSKASAKQVLYYEMIFEAATQFHHSNVRIPIQIESLLNKVIVTPRMHGIHHSVDKEETDSNYSVIFSFWDRIHQTFKAKAKQQQISIGVLEYRDAEQMTPKYLWRMPFKNLSSKSELI